MQTPRNVSTILLWVKLLLTIGNASPIPALFPPTIPPAVPPPVPNLPHIVAPALPGSIHVPVPTYVSIPVPTHVTTVLPAPVPAPTHVPTIRPRCSGSDIDFFCCRRYGNCGEGQGDCESDDECLPGLICGVNNCQQYFDGASSYFDCCTLPERPCDEIVVSGKIGNREEVNGVYEFVPNTSWSGIIRPVFVNKQTTNIGLMKLEGDEFKYINVISIVDWGFFFIELNENHEVVNNPGMFAYGTGRAHWPQDAEDWRFLTDDFFAYDRSVRVECQYAEPVATTLISSFAPTPAPTLSSPPVVLPEEEEEEEAGPSESHQLEEELIEKEEEEKEEKEKEEEENDDEEKEAIQIPERPCDDPIVSGRPFDEINGRYEFVPDWPYRSFNNKDNRHIALIALSDEEQGTGVISEGEWAFVRLLINQYEEIRGYEVLVIGGELAYWPQYIDHWQILAENSDAQWDSDIYVECPEQNALGGQQDGEQNGQQQGEEDDELSTRTKIILGVVIPVGAVLLIALKKASERYKSMPQGTVTRVNASPMPIQPPCASTQEEVQLHAQVSASGINSHRHNETPPPYEASPPPYEGSSGEQHLQRPWAMAGPPV